MDQLDRLIVIVDDNPLDLKLARLLLERQGFTVHTVSDGNEGLGLIEQIRAKLAESHKGDLNTFRDQIKTLLESEIATRYYLDKGEVEAGFRNDPDLKGAIEALNNPSQYKKVLNISR